MAGTPDRVTFTGGAAERIAKAVRKVEQGDRDCGPLAFDRVGNAVAPFALRVATFTGNWDAETFKTVTMYGSTQTANVYNWVNPFTGGDDSDSSQSRYVIFGKAAGRNSVVELPNPELRVATFTGNWETGTYKTVTLNGSTATASVYNWCNPAVGVSTTDLYATRYVVFGKAAGINSAVEIQMRATGCSSSLTLGAVDLTALPGFDENVIQLLGHSARNTADLCEIGLQWYSITTCGTAAASA